MNINSNVFSFTCSTKQMIQLINASILGRDMIIKIEPSGLYLEFNKNEFFLPSPKPNLHFGKIRVKKNDLLYYLEQNIMPEIVDFFVAENIMSCVNGNIDFGTLRIQNLACDSPSEVIKLSDDFLIDEILQLCRIDLKHTLQKKLRHSGIDHVIEDFELDQIKDSYRLEIMEVIKSYITDISLLKGENGTDFQYEFELTENELNGFKEDCVDALLDLLENVNITMGR